MSQLGWRSGLWIGLLWAVGCGRAGYAPSWVGQDVASDLVSIRADLVKVGLTESGAGPFQIGPLFAGDVGLSGGHGDCLTASVPSLATSLGTRQGTLVAWVTPNWDLAESAVDHGFWVLPSFTTGVEGATQSLFVDLGAGRIRFALDVVQWTAGVTHPIIVRWNGRQTLDGAHHLSVTIDQTTAYAVTQPFGTGEDRDVVVGALDASGQSPADAVIAGWTWYRRPLAGVGGGVALGGRTDELERIITEEQGMDPTVLTGSWDVWLALPTDMGVGVVGTTHQAWSHPHGENRLGPAGFFRDGLAGWICDGTASCASPSLEEMVFGVGAEIATTQAGAGLSTVFDALAGEDLVVRALGHGAAGGIPYLLVKDADTGQVLSELSGRAESSRTDLDDLILTLEVPEATTRLQVIISSAVTAGGVYWHQVEVLPNLISNPSFEHGSGDPFVPDDWSHDDLQPSETALELGVVHSGAVSVWINGGGQGHLDQLYQAPSAMVDHAHYATGGFFWWIDNELPGIDVSNGSLFAQDEPYDNRNKLSLTGVEASEWQSIMGVGRRLNSSQYNNWNDLVRWGCTRWGGVGTMYLDDAYVIRLPEAPVSPHARLTPTVLGPDPVMLRVGDSLTQRVDIASREKGLVYLDLALRAPTLPLLAADRWPLLEVEGDARNGIAVWIGPSDWRLIVRINGVEVAQDIDHARPARNVWTRMTVRFARYYGVELLLDQTPVARGPMGEPFGVALETARVKPIAARDGGAYSFGDGVDVRAPGVFSRVF